MHRRIVDVVNGAGKKVGRMTTITAKGKTTFIVYDNTGVLIGQGKTMKEALKVYSFPVVVVIP